MKANGFFRKLNFLIALGGVFAALAFYGCGNLFSSADDAPANFSQPREGYGIVSGNLPSSDSASARTAMPSGGNTPSSYKVFAQNGSQRIEANVNNADRTFSIALPFGTWKITANGLLPNGRIIFTQTKTVTLDASESTKFLQFELGYSTNPDDGDGEISLSVSFPPKKDATSLIRGIEYILSKGEEKIIQNVSDADLGTGRFEIKHTTDNLGAWHLTIQFYGDFSNLVYRIDQTVNVYANLTTDTFEGSTPYILGGNIVLTKALLEDFQSTTLYVNATSGKDTNTGTQFDPLQTFNRALELVNNSTRDANTEFRIFLQTDVADGAMLKLEIEKKLTVASAGADGTARTIKSLGRTFIVPDTSELTVQSVAFEKLRFEVSGTFTMNDGSISGNTANNGGAIYVATTGKATILNTNIFGNSATGGYGGAVCVNGNGIFEMNGGEIHDNHAQYGGAICTGTNTVTITNGIISNNTSTVSGGGVYVYGGTFTMSGGSIIGNESTDTGGASGFGGGVHVNGGTFELKDGGKITGNRAKNGGGISTASAGEVIISDGTISENISSERGGGIYANCPLTMNGGKIHDNISKDTDDTKCFGGGVYIFEASGKFTMNGGEISDNKASDNGGGVYINNNASFTMEGGIISRNESEKSNGGGIYVIGNASTFTMTGGTLSENEAGASGGAVYIYSGKFIMSDTATISGNKAIGSHGGGICIINNATFEMNNGTISGNTAKVNGGGVYVTGDISTFGSFTMKNGTIFKNTANSGGGVCVYNGIFTMEKGEISYNTAKGVNSESFGGGGIFLYCATNSTPGGKFTLKGGTVSRNNAEYGGGIWTSNSSEFAMDGGTFSDNKATNKGNGAYVNPSCTFNMSGAAKFAKNDDVYLCSLNQPQSHFATITVAGVLTAESPVATITPSEYSNEDSDREVLSAGITITQDICDKFALTSPSDDAEWKIAPNGTGTKGVLKKKINIYVRGENATWYELNEPDAVANDDSNSGDRMQPFETIQRAILEVISQNDGTDAYTIFVDGTLDGTKGTADFPVIGKNLNLTIKALSAKATLNASGGSRVINANTGTVGALNLTLENLVITGGNGGGGGIEFLSSSGTLTMTGCEVLNNKANYGGGIYTSGALKMENCTIRGNEAVNDGNVGGDGAGVYIDHSETTMTDCTINGNIATRYGGGIYIEGGNATLTITGGTIESNEAVNGGGVYVNLSTFTMNGTAKISGNTASGNGGGVALIGGEDTFTMNGGEISGNKAAYGAGIHVSGGGKFIMNGGTISGNTADGGTDRNGNNNSGGGGIYVSGNASTFNMTGGTIESNTANVDGGGVALKDGMFTLESGTISGNIAAYGAGVHVSDSGKFTMTGGIISGNTADGNNNSGGGGIHLYKGTVEMSGGEIIRNHAKGTDDDSGGGGIYIYHSNVNTFIMTGTAKISNNDAVRHGGGVYQGAGSNFTSNIMENISDNTPDNIYYE